MLTRTSTLTSVSIWGSQRGRAVAIDKQYRQALLVPPTRASIAVLLRVHWNWMVISICSDPAFRRVIESLACMALPLPAHQNVHLMPANKYSHFWNHYSKHTTSYASNHTQTQKHIQHREKQYVSIFHSINAAHTFLMDARNSLMHFTFIHRQIPILLSKLHLHTNNWGMVNKSSSPPASICHL